jgi:hypothetical protein
VNFYTGQQLLIYNGRINGLWFGSLFPDAPPIFLDDARLSELWRSSTRVYFVTADEKRKQFLETFAPVFAVAQAGGKYVLSNRAGSTSGPRPVR